MTDKKQMKTLGGYEIVDEKAREDINIVAEKADEAYSLAKGATKAFVYDTYEDMISELNTLGKEELLVNYHIMIRTVCVPDLWISGISDEHIEYTYTSNEDFITDLTEDGIVQVGYFVLSALETQKVELDDYVKKDDFATSSKAGLIKPAYGLFVGSEGSLYIQTATKEGVDKKQSGYVPITPLILDYAVKKALSDYKLTGDDAWTEEEKAKALELLGGVQMIPTTTNIIGEVYTNKHNNATGRNTCYLDTYKSATNYAIPTRNGKKGIYIPDGAEEDDGVLPKGQVAVNRNYVDNLVGNIKELLGGI